MPLAEAQGARIYYEITGDGPPILFLHEFAGDWRSWDDQVRHLSRQWRCITMSNRGYPRSDAPADETHYGQDIAIADALCVLDAVGVAIAYVVGLSMGGYTALRLALEHPGRIIAAVAAGAGSGSAVAGQADFVHEAQASAAAMEAAGKLDADGMGHGPTRIQLKNKDRLGWQRFVDNLAEHPAHAAAKTLRQVQVRRPSLYDFKAAMAACKVPTLLIVGDEDEPCLDVNLWMKRQMPFAELAMLPASGHAVNLEEPALFNGLVERFLGSVERKAWRPRDPRASGAGVLTSLGSQRKS